MAWMGSETIFEARIFSTVRSLSFYIAFGLSLAQSRSATQIAAISSGGRPGLGACTAG